MYALKNDKEERFARTRNEIMKAMEKRFGGMGNDELGIDDQRDLVLATMLDARFKFAPYLNSSRMNEYRDWLISAAEKMEKTEVY